MTVEIPPIVSVDDHVVEPPDLWLKRLPRKFQDRAPRVIRAPYEPTNVARTAFVIAASGPETDFWAFEDLRAPIGTGMAAAGLGVEEIDAEPITYERMRPGCYDLKARLADMDVNGVERSLCFPTFPRFCGQTFLEARDKELALACLRVYNDWMIEEWCGESGGRLIPLCLVPLWDAQLAAEEVRRNAARGAKAVAFTELPAHLGLPSLHDRDRYWDPFLTACSETRTVICIHIGSSSKFLNTSDDSPKLTRTALTTINSQLCMADWLTSGVLARYPGIKVAFSESQIGWMPFLFERIDKLWKKGTKANLRNLDPLMTEPPSSYVAGRVFGCFFEDDFGLKSRNSIGIDQITFESDYPHQDSTWPNTVQYAQRAMADLTPEEIRKIVRDNAIAMLDLPKELPA